MKFDFGARTVVITGAASGIGRATALGFAAAGAQVIVSDIDEEGGRRTCEQIAAAAPAFDPAFVQADVSVAAQAESLFDQVINAHSHNNQIDIGINNAGIEGSAARTHQYPLDEWERVMNVNLNGVFFCMRAQLAHMLRQGSGAIVNVASVAGVVGYPWHPAYVASKHAVVGLTRTAALEYVRKGIRVNAVCPGFTDTPMVAGAVAADPAEAQRVMRGIPARRLGKPEEIAAAILYLCSDQAGFVTGHALVADGGITAG